MRLTTIAWQRNASPASWSRIHLSTNANATLCGVKIPDLPFKFFVGGTCECLRCSTIERKRIVRPTLGNARLRAYKAAK